MKKTKRDRGQKVCDKIAIAIRFFLEKVRFLVDFRALWDSKSTPKSIPKIQTWCCSDALFLFFFAGGAGGSCKGMFTKGILQKEIHKGKLGNGNQQIKLAKGNLQSEIYKATFTKGNLQRETYVWKITNIICKGKFTR